MKFLKFFWESSSDKEARKHEEDSALLLEDLNKALKKVEQMNPTWKVGDDSLYFKSPNEIEVSISLQSGLAFIRINDLKNSISLFYESYEFNLRSQNCYNRLRFYIHSFTLPLREEERHKRQEENEQQEARKKDIRDKFLNG
jgi:hypothetical protein